jgi:ACT domain-containing protein
MKANHHLSDVSRLVMQAVHERLGAVDPDVLTVVVREVVSAIADGEAIPPRSAAVSAAPVGLPSVGAAAEHNRSAAAPLPSRHHGGAPEPVPLERCLQCAEQSRGSSQNRAVITTTGRNCKGVVARVAAQIAEAGGDIQDISQTIVSQYFTMIMVVDIGELQLPFAEFKKRLLSTASEMGLHAVVMHEQVMRALQRV